MAGVRGARVQWLEAQYNNRARVPEHPQFLARWAHASAGARSVLGGQIDLPYGSGPKETMDVFGAGSGGGAPRPVLVFIHGGWWRSLDKADHSFVAPAFVEAGAIVVLPNYALCPQVTIGDIACQASRALAQVRRQAAGWGGDPERIVVVGHSAGGHLAAMLLCCDWPRVDPALPAHWLRRAVSLSGVFDLDVIRATPSLQADLRLSPADARALSPARWAAPPQGRLAAFVGALESEEFLRQNTLMRRRWGAATVPVAQTLEGHHHFSIVDDLAEPQGRAHALVRAWLDLPSQPG